MEKATNAILLHNHYYDFQGLKKNHIITIKCYKLLCFQSKYLRIFLKDKVSNNTTSRATNKM
jgi:hypothetical protein